jgi:arginine/serine-rich splicing factor 12
VNHSKNAIVKPQGPSPSETKREVEEALRKVREANLALLEQKMPPTAPEAVVSGSTVVAAPVAVVAKEKESLSKKRTRSRSRSPRTRFASLSLPLSRLLWMTIPSLHQNCYYPVPQ